MTGGTLGPGQMTVRLTTTRQRPQGRHRFQCLAVETVSLGVWVEAGTRHETRPRSTGSSHLLEHMAFKGTRRRDARSPSPRRSRRWGAISTPTPRARPPPITPRSWQGGCGAGPGRDFADILQNSVFDAGGTGAGTRRSILQEIHQAHDTPDDIVFDHFQADRLSPARRIGRPVLGTAARWSKNMPRESLVVDYMARPLRRPGGMVVAAAGQASTTSDFVEQVMAEAFDHAARGKSRRRYEPMPTTAAGISARPGSLDQVQLRTGISSGMSAIPGSRTITSP